MAFIPTIGTRGLYQLLAPFDQALLPNIPYECIAVRRIADVIGTGVEPLETYYTPMGLGEEDYKKDVDAGACLISLQASIGHLLVVPSTYIVGHPNIGGIPYTQLILAASLGPIPDHMDLTTIKTKVATVVEEYIGIVPEIDIVACSLQTILSNEEHEQIEAARRDKVTNTSTDYARYLHAQAQLDQALIKIRELENYIILTKGS